MLFKLNLFLIFRYFSNKKIVFKDYLFELKYSPVDFQKKIIFLGLCIIGFEKENFLCALLEMKVQIDI